MHYTPNRILFSLLFFFLRLFQFFCSCVSECNTLVHKEPNEVNEKREKKVACTDSRICVWALITAHTWNKFSTLFFSAYLTFCWWPYYIILYLPMANVCVSDWMSKQKIVLKREHEHEREKNGGTVAHLTFAQRQYGQKLAVVEN